LIFDDFQRVLSLSEKKWALLRGARSIFKIPESIGVRYLEFIWQMGGFWVDEVRF
jgi:hypothetical protein